MDTSVIVAIISAAAAAIVAPAINYYLTKRKEREAEWQRYRFELYRGVVESLSELATAHPDQATPSAKHFASACNAVYLIASPGVLEAIHKIEESANSGRSISEDELSRSVWEIREALGISDNPVLEDFKMRLWRLTRPPSQGTPE